MAGIEENTQFLTFNLEDETFAVEISRVREVLEFSTVTKVPRTPPSMVGVINLRGAVVPVMDMRRKFGMPHTEQTVNTCIVIMDVSMEDGKSVLGAMVDSVKEVIELSPSHVEPPPHMGTSLRTDFIRGMGKQGDHFVILLNADKVFSSDDVEGMVGAAEAA